MNRDSLTYIEIRHSWLGARHIWPDNTKSEMYKTASKWKSDMKAGVCAPVYEYVLYVYMSLFCVITIHIFKGTLWKNMLIFKLILSPKGKWTHTQTTHIYTRTVYFVHS
jgi:hypothetical protein